MYETTRLATALRMARAVSQMTQQELAAMLGVTKTVIARNEKPDMAMRADTLARLVYVMREQGIEVDVFSTLDSVRLYTTGPSLDAAAMRASRAALSLNQQEFAETLGLTKAIVTRGERPASTMRASTWGALHDVMYERGIKLDWSPMTEELTVIVHRQGVEAIEARHPSKALPGEPDRELVPTSLSEKLGENNRSGHNFEVKNKQ